ncbi:glycyl-radical enzyme activating protein [uncultured Eubacterium sp.]|mgnify:FL=1|uniref:glycyl-radical enzyme activating protein n=1 Tax=uncultured Eubacterium sp. TaxID=165185 RepID=UPI0026731714|nr:glycyl-radical enzyme activating protein [uncultured Eubacterium sp.]
MKGYVFDFKRFSTHDGHGIRTTIFLKGCTLKCVWCQNPEGISITQRPLYFPNKCIHCNTCVHLSENGGVREIDGKIKLDVSKKEDWHNIIDNCPSAALTMDSKEMTVQEVVEEACKDAPFFKYGGGVTLSGGEPLFQHEFAIEILKGLKERGITTTIETASHIPFRIYQEAMKYVDYVFADLKIIDSEMHKKYTGVDNELIRHNLEWLLTSKKAENVIIRTPLIPDMTATKENIAGIAQFISDLYPEIKYEILNYNPLAQAKYDMVDRKYCFENNPPLYSDEQMRAFGKIATDNGVKNLILEI